MDILRNDEDLKKMRLEWERYFTTPFPSYNYDQYAGIDDYKNELRVRFDKKKKDNNK